ncbi:hypothetical protein DXG01_008791 [Tephrocybe rancida]|nr:hypothetical protein DXG01_008791 [Tephrocybe rancida]
MAQQVDKGLSFSFSAEPDDENPRFLLNITMEVTHPELGAIASMSVIQIRRHFCGDSFLEIMDENSDELQKFSVALFDKFGRVRPWLLEPGNRRGTGCWGDELNYGELIYVLDMSVNKERRGKGLGSLMLQKLIDSEYVSDRDTLICWPTPVGVTDKNEWTALKEKEIAFFRKKGFRRIGRTGFFGYSSNPTHPSRAISIADDADEQGKNFDVSAVLSLSADEVKEKYPLHFAIVNSKGQEVVDLIKSHYQSDPSSIHKPDASGFTPIHVALGKADPDVVRVLLELGVTEDLNNANNAEDSTPLECLKASMRSTREFSETLLPQWDGHSDAELTCEYLAKRAMSETVISDTLEGYITKRKWGCTCGACAGGWLTKRMRFRLQCDAGLAKDGMEMEMYSFERGVPQDGELLGGPSDYLPGELRRSIFKTFYVGYQSIFDAIYDFLERTDEPLSKAAIVARTLGSNGVSFFYSKGGQIEYAFDAITHRAMEQSPLGDSTFEETWEEEGDSDYTRLPACANDLEFSLVRQRLGLNPRSQWGPYYDFGDGGGGGMDDDDDDDDDDEDMGGGVLSWNMNPQVIEAMVRQLTARRTT